MQIRNLTKWSLVATLLFAGWAITAGAADDPAPVNEEQAPAETDGDNEEIEAASDSVGGQMGEVSLDRFIPTEEISADGAVSFPVDI
ncbi:MAG: hypothetical protein KJP03_06690 [Gammaproteobacteria bacterium]|nr:hypothetical protein [Gammaproteobacteria bacterium]